MTVELDECEQRSEFEHEKYIHQQKTAAIGTFAGGIIHEIGNPVAAISELVRDMHEDDERGTLEHENLHTNCYALQSSELYRPFHQSQETE